MRVLTLRVDEKTYGRLEEVRRREGVRSQSELMRRAIRLFLREQRRKELRRELAEYAKDKENLRVMAELADADFEDAMARIDQMEEETRRCGGE